MVGRRLNSNPVLQLLKFEFLCMYLGAVSYEVSNGYDTSYVQNALWAGKWEA